MKSIEFINEILKEWASRIENGKPNPADCYHISLLSQVLREMKLSNEFIGEFIGNLNTEQKNTCEINSGIASEILEPLLKEETGSYDFRLMGGDALTGAFGGDASGPVGGVGSESVGFVGKTPDEEEEIAKKNILLADKKEETDETDENNESDKKK